MTSAYVVATARRYLNLPTRHQGRTDATDCVGLVLAVAEDLALLDVAGVPILRAQYANYSAQPADGFVHEECKRRLVVRKLPTKRDSLERLREELEPGDVLTMRLPRVPCHTAIVCEVQGAPGIIHAYSPVGRVVEHRLDVAWLHRIAGVFRFPGVVSGG